MTNVPKIRIPRLRDLLSRPLGCLTGHPLQAFNELFDQFDQTLSENTCAIQASLCNIARAPYRLAEKCGPVIEELIAAQRSASDPNNIGETSRRNNSGIEEDFVDPHNDQLFEHGNGGVFRTSSSCYRDDVLRDGNGQNLYSTDPATSKTGGTTPCTKPHQEACRDDHARTTTCSGLHYNMQLSGFLPDSNHDMNRINNLIDAIYCEEQSNHMHTLPSSRTTQFEDQAKTDQNNMVSGTLHVSEQRTGKRMTRKPAKYSSPFKYGIMSRPAPNVDAAMSLFGHMCADDSTLKSTPLTCDMIAQSFADGAIPESTFITGFVKCLSYDDYWIRPECHGYRIFFDADLSAILNVEWHKRDSSEPKYSQFAAVTAIQRCLPFTNLKKTKMILLPVLHQHHWSVYCVNFGQSRIDVLDSMLYTPESDNNWDNDALSIAAPLKFKSFKNWRHVPVKVPVQKAMSDNAFFAMKFLEFYDGDGHGSLHTSIAAERSKELRAETLYYLTFHKQNKVVALPDEILQYRRDDHHPFFY
uniref:Ubiquitin-like protease family profile domain-containing protein n=1 Tax=Setaria italica TaxID=4555 RepID=K3YDD2_SETIT